VERKGKAVMQWELADLDRSLLEILRELNAVAGGTLAHGKQVIACAKESGLLSKCGQKGLVESLKHLAGHGLIELNWPKGGLTCRLTEEGEERLEPVEEPVQVLPEEPRHSLAGLASCNKGPDLKLAGPRAVVLALVEVHINGNGWARTSDVYPDIRRCLDLPPEVYDASIGIQLALFKRFGELRIRGSGDERELQLTEQGRVWCHAWLKELRAA
jgi:hypothetical protein